MTLLANRKAPKVGKTEAKAPKATTRNETEEIPGNRKKETKRGATVARIMERNVVVTGRERAKIGEHEATELENANKGHAMLNQGT